MYRRYGTEVVKRNHSVVLERNARGRSVLRDLAEDTGCLDIKLHRNSPHCRMSVNALSRTDHNRTRRREYTFGYHDTVVPMYHLPLRRCPIDGSSRCERELVMLFLRLSSRAFFYSACSCEQR